MAAWRKIIPASVKVLKQEFTWFVGEAARRPSVPGGMFEEGSGGRMLECELRATCMCVSRSVVSISLLPHGL